MNATLKNEGNTSTILRPDTGGVTTDSLATKYKMLTRSSAVNIIELGKTVCQAKDLGEGALSEFCSVVNLDPRGSTYRKHLIIGSSAGRFVPHIDRMPASWTTIYKLACLNEKDFDTVVTNDDFSPAITAKDISEILGQTTHDRSSRTEGDVTVTLDLSALSNDDRRTVYHEIESLRESHEFKMRLSDAMREVIGTSRPTSRTSAAFQMEQAT